ncbi:MAG: hypothetical protein JO256_00660 [Alphaproteobacteria bacterium]|nr:hypothetical protein [Alphaproteobacteria bacterium]
MSEVRYVYVDRPRSHGCLWGCLAVLLLLSLPVIFAGWYGWSGFRQSPAMRAAVEMVENDALAGRVLGRPITVIGVEGHGFDFSFGRRARTSYVLHVQGPRGEGYLDVTSHVEGGRARIDTLKLTGPDGHDYDLLHHAPLPSDDGGAQPI